MTSKEKFISTKKIYIIRYNDFIGYQIFLNSYKVLIISYDDASTSDTVQASSNSSKNMA